MQRFATIHNARDAIAGHKKIQNNKTSILESATFFFIRDKYWNSIYRMNVVTRNDEVALHRNPDNLETSRRFEIPKIL